MAGYHQNVNKAAAGAVLQAVTRRASPPLRRSQSCAIATETIGASTQALPQSFPRHPEETGPLEGPLLRVKDSGAVGAKLPSDARHSAGTRLLGL